MRKIFALFALLLALNPAQAARFLFSNNASTTLASALTSSGTTLTVSSGTGARFPAPAATGDHFRATLVKNGNPNLYEIVDVTVRAGDVMTIARGQEGTTALTWNSGDLFNLFPTAGGLTSMSQAVDTQKQAGNYAVDVGPTANAFVAPPVPAITAHVVGMPIRWVASHTNTAAVTFSDGVGAAPVVTEGGVPLVAGQIIAGFMYEVVWIGGEFQLLGSGYATRAYASSQATSAQTAAQAFATAADATVLTNAQNYAANLVTQAIASTEAFAQSYTNAQVAPLAPKASPTFSGIPIAPTAPLGSKGFQLANTFFVQTAIDNAVGVSFTPGAPGGSGSYTLPPDPTSGLAMTVKWGVFTTPSTGSSVIVNYPSAFAHSTLNVHLTLIGFTQSYLWDPTYLTGTGFRMNFGAINQRVAYIAIGY